MVDEIVAKIVFDETSLKKSMEIGGGGGGTNGFVDALSKTGMGLDTPVIGEIGAAVGGLVLALNALVDVAKWGFKKLVDASPHLQATMSILAKAVKITLRPIGDVVSSFLRPFLIGWLRFVLPVYKAWRQWFGEGGGAEAKIEMGEGFTKLKEGLFEMDFEKMWEGMKGIASGFKNLFTSFGEEVLGPQLNLFYEWWATLQEKFNTSGVFDTLWGIIKEGVSWAWGAAWEWVEGQLEKTKWGQKLLGFKDGLWGMWLDFAEEMKAYEEWPAVVRPFMVAMETLWGEFVPGMADTLVTALNEALPGFKEAMSFLFEKDDTGETAFGKWIESTTSLKTVLTLVSPVLMGIYDLTMSKFGKDKDEMGDTVIGTMNKTGEAMQVPIDQAIEIQNEINAIPSYKKVTIEIETIRTGDD